jgi:uncharacterized protein YfiM (DUF2279 family)
MAIKPITKPLAPSVRIVNSDGTPTKEFHEYLTRLHADVGGINGRLGAIEAAIPAGVLWAPTLAGNTVAGAHTYAIRTGRAQRVRDMVSVAIDVGLSAKDPAMAGTGLFITDLPWPAAAEGMLACGYTGIGNPANTAVFGYVTASGVGLLYSTAGSGWNWVTAAMITNATRMFMTGSYVAAPL